MLSVDARALCPAAEARDNPWLRADFKRALVPQFGLDEGYAIYRTMLGLPDWGPIEKRRVESLRDYAAQRALQFTQVYPAGERFELAAPKVVGAGERRNLAGTARSFFVACLADARIDNESLLVRVDGTPLLDYQDDELASIAETFELDPHVFAASGDEIWMIPDRHEAIEVDEAFGSLLGRASGHFGDFIFEFLPKYLTALASGALPRGVPVLRRSLHLPQSLKEMIDLLLPKGTDVIEVPPAPVRVKRLWCAPSLMYVPIWERMNSAFGRIDHFCFPPERLRPTLAAMRALLDDAGAGTGSRRVYLARKSDGFRSLLNSEAVEARLAARGFTTHYLEDHSFLEQVRLVRDADFIVGPWGSALYMSYFAKPNANVCILNHRFTYYPLAYFAPIAAATGFDVTIFTGDVDLTDLSKDYGLLYDFDFRIDERAFSIFLDGWLAA